MRKMIIILIAILAINLSASVRIKDISFFSGLENKQLIGYGLVVGLDGTGDGGSSQITVQSIKNMMDRFGISVPESKIKPNNVAAVMLTAKLPPFAKVGSSFDVIVSSIGDAKSLEGGTLLMTALTGMDELQYATAQGQISIGGFNTASRGSQIRKNYALVGRIPDGAIVEREIYNQVVDNGEILLNLKNGDFTTSQRIAESINRKFDLRLAYPEDGMSISIIVPDTVLIRNNLVNFMSTIENLSVNPEQKARVVINERTGTIVAGGNVQISEVAVAHGNLVIEISQQDESLEVGGFSQTSQATNIEATDEKAQVMVMKAATVKDLAKSLNSIKVTPRDLISIFQSLKAAGALQAELLIM